MNIPENFSDYKPRKLAACAEVISGIYGVGMVRWGDMSASDRLRVLRKALGLTQDAFAASIGADPDTDAYGKAERSGNISQMAPLIYRRYPEIDAGWLFQGLAGNLSNGFEKRLEDAAKALGLVPVGRRKV